MWQSSLALERIINELGQTQAAFGVAVYVALCRLSSKQKGHSPVIQASVSKIAGQARLGYRKTLETLHDLADKAAVISIEDRRKEGTKERDESIYTLLDTKLPDRNNGLFPRGHPPRNASHAENPIDSPFGRESKKNKEEEVSAPLGGSALEAQPPACGKPKGQGVFE